MVRSPHPEEEVEEALKHAEEQGWGIEVGGIRTFSSHVYDGGTRI